LENETVGRKQRRLP